VYITEKKYLTSVFNYVNLIILRKCHSKKWSRLRKKKKKVFLLYLQMWQLKSLMFFI